MDLHHLRRPPLAGDPVPVLPHQLDRDVCGALHLLDLCAQKDRGQAEGSIKKDCCMEKAVIE